jgi:hypothetical protein
MASGFNEIIAQLERQREAIDRALAALREVDGRAAAAPPAERKTSKKSASAAKPAKTKRKSGMTPEGKERLVAALKARWAAKKAAEAVPAPKTAGKRGRPKKSE